MTKILFIDHSPKPGGATRALLNLLDGLDNRVFAPVVVCPAGSEIVRYFEEKKLPVETTSMPWFTKRASIVGMLSYWYYLLSFAIFVRRVVKKHNISIIHANSFISAIYAVLPAIITNKPLIWHMHDIIEAGTFNKIFIRIAGWESIKIICVSEAVRKRLIEFGVDALKCRVIYNYMPGSLPETGMKKGTFRGEVGISEKTKLVGMIGNICELKGQSVFLEGAAEIVKKFPDTLFVIVGDIISESDKIYKTGLHEYVEENGLACNVFFTGFRDDVLTIMNDLDILVHPAVLPEAFGLVLLEAMDSEKPVVASNIGGIPEIVDDGVSGFLVKPGDVQELVEAVCMLLADTELRNRMGKEGKRILGEKFSAENYINRMNAVYQELLSS